MDGTIISAWAPSHKHNSYKSRKSQASQNVLVICDFDMLFTYVYAECEGSANDARVLMNAIGSDGSFPISPRCKDFKILYYYYYDNKILFQICNLIFIYI